MKHLFLLLFAALLFCFAIGCHAVGAVIQRSAIPPDWPQAGIPSGDACAPLNLLAVAPAPSCDMLCMVISPAAYDYHAGAIDLQRERRPDLPYLPFHRDRYVMRITDHGWYWAAVHRPKCDWRLQSTWHPSGRSL